MVRSILQFTSDEVCRILALHVAAESDHEVGDVSVIMVDETCDDDCDDEDCDASIQVVFQVELA